MAGTDRLRDGIGRLLGEEWPSADVLDMLERDAKDRHEDPLAAEVAAKCGVRFDDEPPQEQRDPRSTRAIAASLMQASTVGSTPDPDEEPDPPDNLTVTVAERLRRKDNAGASNLGVLPRQSKEQ